jgi:pimeloyl-ACP methyl ester carboxylesterase
LWFNGKLTGKAATRAYMERIYTPERPERANVTAEAGAKQRAAIVDWWENSFLMAQRLPNAQLIIYPDSGHASLFQYPETFSEHVLKFLRDQDNGGLR